jgi:hypothetical protein
MQALDRLELQAGQWLLVTGAAGALGGFALELAALRGLRTLAVASSQDEALVRQLGANEFIPRTDNLGIAVRRVLPRGVDGALDAALLGMPALDAVRDGGSPRGSPQPNGWRLSQQHTNASPQAVCAAGLCSSPTTEAATPDEDRRIGQMRKPRPCASSAACVGQSSG